MKKVSLPLAAALIVFIAAGCASAPNWANRRAPRDEIWGTGTAKLQSDSLSQQAATARARRQIAEYLGVVVQGAFSDFEREAASGERTIPAYVVESVLSEIMDPRHLSRTQVVARERTSDGTWWVRVSIKKADAEKLINDIADSKAAGVAEDMVRNAFQGLNARFDNFQTNPVPRSED